jgi:hypothetical protein
MQNRPVAIAALTIWIAITGAVAIGQEPERVETAIALAQLTKRIEPVGPGTFGGDGRTTADITIDATGRVTSVTVLSGIPVFHRHLRLALERWTFKPFARDGKPHSVIVTIEHVFPRMAEAESRAILELQAAAFQCERELEIDVARALPLCEAAMELTHRLPPRPFDTMAGDARERTARGHLTALMQTGRLRESIDAVKQMIANRSNPAWPDDRIVPQYYDTLALLQQRVGANEDAELTFSKADALYAELAAQQPDPSYFNPRLQQALQRHAAFRRSRGDEAGATALDARAAAIVIAPAQASRRPVETTRRLGDLTIVESAEARVNYEDIRQIQAVLPGIWWMRALQLIDFRVVPEQSELSVTACVAPEVTTSVVRHGRCSRLVRKVASGQPARWERSGSGWNYVQVMGVASQRPIEIEIQQASLPSDDVLADLVRYVLRQAVASPSPRKREVQPWPITNLDFGTVGNVLVTVKKEDNTAFQWIVLRAQGGAWTIVDIAP